MRRKLIRTTVPVLVLALPAFGAEQGTAPEPVTEDDKPFLLNYPALEDSAGEVVLTNEHVVLQRLVVPAGEWEGIHSHPGNQIYVHIEGASGPGDSVGKSSTGALPAPTEKSAGWMKSHSARGTSPAIPVTLPST